MLKSFLDVYYESKRKITHPRTHNYNFNKINFKNDFFCYILKRLVEVNIRGVPSIRDVTTYFKLYIIDLDI